MRIYIANIIIFLFSEYVHSIYFIKKEKNEKKRIDFYINSYAKYRIAEYLFLNYNYYFQF